MARARRRGTGAITPARSGRFFRSSGATRFALLLVLTFGALALLTLAAFLLPAVSYARITPQADSVISTAAMASAAAVAAFAWLRFRDRGDLDALLQSSAFLVLCVSAVVRTVVVVSGFGNYHGFDISTAGQAPLYMALFSQMFAGALLAAGAVSITRGWLRPGTRTMLVVLFGPAVITVAMAALAMARETDLPQLLPLETLQRLLNPKPVFESHLISVPLFALELVAAAVFGVAARAYGRIALAGQRGVYTGLLAISLVVAAFSQVHSALAPGGYADLLTSGDFLRLAFYLLVLAAVGWAIQDDHRQLRRAYRELERLRQADAERIGAETRAGLAREVHDGLVQELWLARLTTGQLADVPRLPRDARPMLGRLDVALERAMFEARQALITLQPRSTTGFGDLLRRFVDDYSDRFDLDIQMELASNDEPPLPPDVQSELLRICREALNNVRKHADASSVRVRLERNGDGLRLLVSDNGRGFEPAANGNGFGLSSMQQRATKIGAKLSIRSAPMDGALVAVDLPLRPPA